MYPLVKPTFCAISVSISLMMVSTMVMAVMPVAVQTDSTEAIEYSPDELLVKFKTITSVSKSNAVDHLKSTGHLKPTAGTSLATLDIVSAEPFGTIKKSNVKQSLKQSSFHSWWHIKLGKGSDLQQALETLSARPDVEFVEYNYVVHANLIPNDPRFGSLWGLNNTQQTGGSFDADIDAPEAWDNGTGSDNIIVAVFDTGVDYGHEDLAANMWKNPGEIPGNGMDDDDNGYIDDVYGYDFINKDSDPFDDHGHGTHVAGTIAAVGNNGIGVTGVSWNAQIMAVKFLGASGSGLVSDAVTGVIYAVNHGAKILNNSWGGSDFSQALLDAINDANDADRLFVAAAGNNTLNNDVSQYYPSGYATPNVISVAATDHNDQLAEFSSYGVNTVHLGAPGVDVLSTVPTGSCSLCDSEGYASLSGTSMATPHVSGAAALVLSQIPQLSIADLKSRLMLSVDQVPALSGTTISGGRLNINSSSVYDPDISITLTPSIQSVLPGETATYTVTVTSLSDTAEQVNLSLGTLGTGVSADFADSRLTPPVGGSITTTLTVTVPLNVARGTYSVRVLGSNEIDEIDSYAFVAYRALRPGLIIDAGFSNAETPWIEPGESIGYSVALTPIDGFASTLTISATSPHASILMDVSGSPIILRPDSITGSADIIISTEAVTPLGSYAFEITVTDGQYTQIINAQFDVVGKPDLTVSSVLIRGNPTYIATYLDMEYVIHSVAGGRAIDSYLVGIYLSSDADVTTGDTRISTATKFTLAGGDSVASRDRYFIPSDLASGTYYLGVIVDYDNQHNETDEGNNVAVASTTLTLSQKADLTLTNSLVLLGDADGDTLTIDGAYGIRNTGSAPTNGGYRVGYYLTKESRATTADFLIGSTEFLELAAGDTVSQPLSLIVPSDLPAGSYRLGLIIDDDNRQSEISENNNLRMTTLTLEVDADLLISSVSTPDSQVHAGDSIDVTYTIHNAGNSPAENFLVGLYLSSDATITTEDTLIGQDLNFMLTATTLAGGDAYTQTLSFFPIPSSLIGNDYYLGVIVDHDNRQRELDEGNNTLASNTTLDISGVFDLYSYFKSGDIPDSAYAGTPFEVTHTVVNGGSDATSGGYRVGYYLTKEPRATTADIHIHTSDDLPELAGRSSFEQTSTLIIPSSVAAGTYTLGIIIDNGNQQDESDENNNLMRKGDFRVLEVSQEADLRISSVTTLNNTVYTGASIDVTYAVHNAGGSSTSGSSVVGIYLSTDADITTVDTRLGARYMPSLVAGGTHTQTASFRIPASLAGGDYYLGVIADYNNRQAESNDENNVGRVETALEVKKEIDLSISSVSIPVSSVYTGAAIDVTYAVHNAGGSSTSGSSVVGIYLSTDDDITTADTRLGARYMHRLAAGGTHTQTASFRIPASLAGGNYYLGVIADYNNREAESWEGESREENNVGRAGSALEVKKEVDLQISSVESSISEVYTGAYIDVTYAVYNAGGSSASVSSVAGIYLSTDAVINTEDTRLGARYMHRLAAGGTHTQKASLRIPSGLVGGDYYLGVIADYNNREAESDEENNAGRAESTLRVSK